MVWVRYFLLIPEHRFSAALGENVRHAATSRKTCQNLREAQDMTARKRLLPVFQCGSWAVFGGISFFLNWYRNNEVWCNDTCQGNC